MGPLNIVLAILLFVSAIFLIVAVLMQSGKDKGTGVITGGASETYFGRNKGKSKEKKLALITSIVAIVFVILTILTFVLQPKPIDTTTNPSAPASDSSTPASSDTAASSSTGSTPASSTPASSNQ